MSIFINNLKELISKYDLNPKYYFMIINLKRDGTFAPGSVVTENDYKKERNRLKRDSLVVQEFHNANKRQNAIDRLKGQLAEVKVIQPTDETHAKCEKIRIDLINQVSTLKQLNMKLQRQIESSEDIRFKYEEQNVRLTKEVEELNTSFKESSRNCEKYSNYITELIPKFSKAKKCLKGMSIEFFRSTLGKPVTWEVVVNDKIDFDLILSEVDRYKKELNIYFDKSIKT